jgi:hypothetical protein
MLAELWSMHALLGKHARSVPAARLLRAQLLCSALAILMPAGRAVGESARAATLTGTVPTPVAVATSALGQVLTLVVNGAVGVLGALVASRLGFVGFAGICLIYGAALLAAGSALFIAMRSQRLAALLARWSFTARWADPFLRAGRALSFGSTGLGSAFAAHTLVRVLQAAQLALLAAALGHTRAWADAPMLQVIYMLGAAVGDLVPAQIGTVDAAFALAGPLLDMKVAATLALGLALHALQLLAAAMFLLSALALPRPRTPASGQTDTSKESREPA